MPDDRQRAGDAGATPGPPSSRREEILARARPLPDDWGFDDLTEDERESFLAAVRDL